MFLSGTVPVLPDGTIPKGKVGLDVTTEQAIQQARLVGLNILAVLEQELGDLDRVRRIVKLLGMVNAVPEFTEQSRVINGCSDLLTQVFGERHARSAIGVREPAVRRSRWRSRRSPRSTSPGLPAPRITSRRLRASGSPSLHQRLQARQDVLPAAFGVVPGCFAHPVMDHPHPS